VIFRATERMRSPPPANTTVARSKAERVLMRRSVLTEQRVGFLRRRLAGKLRLLRRSGSADVSGGAMICGASMSAGWCRKGLAQRFAQGCDRLRAIERGQYSVATASLLALPSLFATGPETTGTASSSPAPARRRD